MSSFFAKAIRHVGYFRYLPLYWWYHKIRFGITNTKFDISWSVFRDSFIQDHYDIRRFLDAAREANTLFFLDIGRNHGFVFYYAMHHIMRSGFRTSVVNYVGIDPAPLKFVYFNYFQFLRRKKITVNYMLLDKAVVFDGEKRVKLKYGESNFGNFNVSGSNFAQKLSSRQRRYEFVEITVETIGLEEIEGIVRENRAADALIIKIDCKNQTTRLFLSMLDGLRDFRKPYLVTCEYDTSGDRDVSGYRKHPFNTLAASNLFTEPRR